MRTPICQSRFGYIVIWACCFLVLVIISSCSAVVQDIELKEITPLPQPLFNPLPLSILVYYDNDFSDYTATYQNPNHSVTNTIRVGSFNADLFNYLLPNVFEDVRVVPPNLSESNVTETIDLVIKPAVLAFDYWRTSNFDHLRILYSLTFSLPGGEHVGSWEIRSHRSIPVTGFYSRRRTDLNIRELSHTVARELSAKFIVNICNQTFIAHISSPHCSDEIL